MKTFKIEFKTNCGKLIWVTHAENVVEACKKGKKEILSAIELSGFIIKEIKEIDENGNEVKIESK